MGAKNIDSPKFRVCVCFFPRRFVCSYTSVTHEQVISEFSKKRQRQQQQQQRYAKQVFLLLSFFKKAIDTCM